MRILILLVGILLFTPFVCRGEGYGSKTVFQGGWVIVDPSKRVMGAAPLSIGEETRLGYEPEAKEPDGEGHREPAHGPRHFDVDKDGNIYIVDPLKRRVVKFNKQGRYLFSFGENDYGTIAIDKEGNIYVDASDGHGWKILKFNPKGEFVKKIEEINGRRITFLMGIFSRHDNGNICIKAEIEGSKEFLFYEFDPQGNLVKEKRGRYEDKYGRVYRCKVVNGEPINNQLEAVSPDGKVVKEITLDIGESDPRNWGCVGYDKEGNFYYMDYSWGKGDRIYKYNSDGRLIDSFKVKPIFENTIGGISNFKVLPDGTVYQMHATDEGLSIIKYEPKEKKLKEEEEDKVNEK